MSQKPILKKLGLVRRHERLPECIGFDFSETRERDWGNLVTIHRQHANSYVWKYKHKVVTEMVLRQPHWTSNHRKFQVDPNNFSTAVAVSPCGHFCVVGSKGGRVYKYNLQSGSCRGDYPSSAGEYATLKKGTVDMRSRIPGNVLYEEKRMAMDHQSVGLNSPPRAAEGSGSARGPFQQEKGHTGSNYI